jgi:hypothetical protein
LAYCHHTWTVNSSDISEQIESKQFSTSCIWMPNWCPPSTQPIAAYSFSDALLLSWLYAHDNCHSLYLFNNSTDLNETNAIWKHIN